MPAAHLSFDNLTNPLWLVATNLFGDGITLLIVDRFGDVLVDSLAPLVRVLRALLVDNLLLPDLRHLLAVGGGDVVAVLHRHHLRLVLLYNLAILCWLFHAMFACVASLGFLVNLNGFAYFVVAPRPGILGLSSVTFHLGTFLADAVLVAVALLKHRGAYVAGAP